ncbi:hemagglutinin [Microbacteriaceae bacterium VKM Ac-2855]|nr:hemagglutinin [Microbacteriaceae bacterium VKM Ac-2855]
MKRRGRAWASVVVGALVVGAGAATAPTEPVPAATDSATTAQTVRIYTDFQPQASTADFDADDIISDAVFFDGDAMGPVTVQAFLEARVPVCSGTSVPCLRDYAEETGDVAADAECGAYFGAAEQTAAEIIAQVGSVCGVNPAVLLALLQKEQSLIGDDEPSERKYRSATGYGCPDTADCDTDYYGFFSQIYGAAWQFKRYANPQSSFDWYPVGERSPIQFAPDPTCGAAPVLIENAATAGLYYYTPYQPNAAALTNLYGEGDGCSSYGNRNFWRIFTNWFGSTHAR